MRAGESIAYKGLKELGYTGKDFDWEGRKEPIAVILTAPEKRRIQKLDPWKLKPIVKNCPLCGGKYIPTAQSEKVCIPCNYIG